MFGQTRGTMMVIGKITKCMDKERSFGKMVDVIKENIMKTRRRVIIIIFSKKLKLLK